MQLHRGVRRDAWIFCLDYGRLMGDPIDVVSEMGKLADKKGHVSFCPDETFSPARCGPFRTAWRNTGLRACPRERGRVNWVRE
jgi:hypothetical protein